MKADTRLCACHNRNGVPRRVAPRHPEMEGAVMKFKILILCLLLSVAASATDTDQLALDVADAQKANQAAVTKYSWHAKTILNMDGAEKATVINEMRFNTEGKLEATQVGGESSVEQKRGVRGRQQKKKTADMSEYLNNVLELSFQYIFMSKGTLVDMFDKAKITEGEKSIDISAADLFVKGDVLTMTVDPATNLATGLTFTTTMGEDTINGTVTMKMLEKGPGTPAHVEIDIPTQKIKISSETYDWLEQK